MQGGHQSEPVNSTNTDFFSSFAFSKAASRSVDQPARSAWQTPTSASEERKVETTFFNSFINYEALSEEIFVQKTFAYFSDR
jgi:hypothetical protein